MTHKLSITNLDTASGVSVSATRVELIVWQEDRAAGGDSVIRTAISAAVIAPGETRTVTIGDQQGITAHEIAAPEPHERHHASGHKAES